VEDVWEAGLDVVVLDRDERVIDRIKDRSSAAFVGDATDPEVLTGVGLSELDTAVVSFGQYFEASVLCVASLSQIGVRHIIARAETPRQESVLKAVGAHRVLQLEEDMGRRFAYELIAPVTEELVDFADRYRVLPWSARGPLVGKTLGEARLRQDYEIHVLGYRRHDERTPHGQKARLHIPAGNYRIQAGDTLLIVGDDEKVNAFVDEIGQEP
jgi:trk system potassium uptake protein TrkA